MEKPATWKQWRLISCSGASFVKFLGYQSYFIPFLLTSPFLSLVLSSQSSRYIHKESGKRKRKGRKKKRKSRREKCSSLHHQEGKRPEHPVYVSEDSPRFHCLWIYGLQLGKLIVSYTDVETFLFKLRVVRTTGFPNLPNAGFLC